LGEDGRTSATTQGPLPDNAGEANAVPTEHESNAGPAAASATNQENAVPMLDVHAPHDAVRTWKDFFIHIAAIAVGLLIAIGLEQTVEYFHHRHQVAEIRRSLAEERRMNEVIFTSACNEFRRYAPILLGSLQTLTYLRTHPGAPPSQWPGRFSFYISIVHFQDSAWKVALQSAALAYMPRAEVQTYSDVYTRLAEISDHSLDEFHAIIRAKSFMLQITDPSSFNSEQSIQAYALISDVVTNLYLMGVGERSVANSYSDFHGSPTDAELYALIPPAPPKQDVEAVREIAAPMNREK
jgi:hypothetical protein